MKNFAIFTIMMLSASFVNAETLFPNNNPFPQTAPQSLNNIYEAEPAVIQEESNKKQKLWFKRKNKKSQTTNSSDYVVPESKIINEGTNDGSFYVFK